MGLLVVSARDWTNMTSRVDESQQRFPGQHVIILQRDPGWTDGESEDRPERWARRRCAHGYHDRKRPFLILHKL